MARLEKPLSGDTAATIRQLYKLACNLRLQLISTEEHSDSTKFESDLSAINVIIVITGLYFSQGEAFATLSET